MKRYDDEHQETVQSIVRGTTRWDARTSMAPWLSTRPTPRSRVPLVRRLVGSDEGICRGREELRRFIAMVFERTPPERRRFRGGYFTDGKTVVWEYPRSTPEGEQMDFVEVMEIADSLIVRHRVYWGWFGLRILERDAYLR